MKHNDKSDKAQELACKALERLEAEGLAPTPRNFEVFYCYFDGHPDITGAIDRIKEKINQSTCETLHERFLSNSRSEEALRKVGDQVQKALAEIAVMLSSVRSAATGYGENLEDVSGKIQSARTIDELQSVMTYLVEDTKKMIAHNQSLEEQLGSSSNQVAELRKSLDTVRREAMTDGLTGLSNRKSFDRHIEAVAAEALKLGKPFTLLMLDIDHFKSFNDNFGHQIGDQVLRLVAKTLTDGVKGRDFAARYGGEEFAIILPETPLQAGVAVGNSLRREVERKEVVNRSSKENLGRITLSVGVAEFFPGESLPDLIDRADAALYTAKHNGRNQVAAAPPPAEAKRQQEAK